ncbi:MAG TPA: Nudix family hydrolase [Gammaproteobacteria bacterium]|nr:Nudix family hydrolase [Gammaproteobacteria bacterium]
MDNCHGRVLVAQRPRGKSLAGAWEFPGGKLHFDEDRLTGLVREFDEELGIQVEVARPLIRFRHSYPDLEVDLDAWRIERWHGEPHGREGQAIGWYAPEELEDLGLLPADTAIVRAIRLPAMCAVTSPRAEQGEGAFLDQVEQLAAHSGAGLICLRRPDLDPADLLELAAGAACRIEGTAARLLLHGDPAALAPALVAPPKAPAARFESAVAGLHIPGRYLDTLAERPVPPHMWFGVSCHDARQLYAALALGADYAFLGPVKPTASHPGVPGMGWEKFAALVADLPLPVYGIGGLGPTDLDDAWAAGAQGIAAIRALNLTR